MHVESGWADSRSGACRGITHNEARDLQQSDTSMVVVSDEFCAVKIRAFWSELLADDARGGREGDRLAIAVERVVQRPESRRGAVAIAKDYDDQAMKTMR